MSPLPVVKLARRRDRWARALRRAAFGLGGAPIALGLLQWATGAVPAATFHEAWPWLITIGPLAAIGASVSAAALYGLTGLRTRPGTLEARDGRVIAKDGAGATLADEAAVGGVVTPRAKGAGVALELAGGDTLIAQVDDVAQGERALEALGLGPEARATEIATRGPVRATLRALFAAAAASLGVMIGFGMYIGSAGPPPKWVIPIVLVLTFLSAWGAAKLTRPTRLRIGTDGLLVLRPTGDTLYRFRDLASVAQRGARIVLTPKGEREVVIRTASEEIAAAAVHRAREALGGQGTELASTSLADRLAPRGRGASALRKDHAAWVRGASAFRGAPVSAEALAEVLADAKQAPALRVSAALALRELGPEARERVRIAADASVDPVVKGALVRIAAGGDDDAQAEAEVDAALAAQEAEAEAGHEDA